MPKLRGRFSMRGFYALKANDQYRRDSRVLLILRETEIGRQTEGATHLRGLLGSPRLTLGERRRSGFFALLRRLSLRKEDHQRIVFTK